MDYSVQVIIEIPFGSNVKYEVQKDGRLRVDRVLSTSMVYPGNYGFIPDTITGDGDPTDVLILNHTPFFPGSVVECRVVGVLETEDEKGMDEKVLAVPSGSIDPQYHTIQDIGDVPDSEKLKIRHFFEHYKNLETGKFVRIVGFDNRDAAMRMVKNAAV